MEAAAVLPVCILPSTRVSAAATGPLLSAVRAGRTRRFLHPAPFAASSVLGDVPSRAVSLDPSVTVTSFHTREAAKRVG